MRITVLKQPGGVFDVLVEPGRRSRQPVVYLRKLGLDALADAVGELVAKIAPLEQGRLPLFQGKEQVERG